MFIPQKLPKYIRDRTSLSHKEIERVLLGDSVRLFSPARCVELELSERYVFDEDRVFVDGVELLHQVTPHAFALNKPRSVTVTTRDPKGKQDLSKWLRALPSGVFPVGRLDRETTGLLLLTNDGDLASVLTRPEHHVRKSYWLWLNESLSNQDQRLVSWMEGMTLRGRLARAETVRVLTQTEDMSELLVELSQGIHRQIRRMCRASDLRLLHLHRRSIGPINVGELELGQVRPLQKTEVDALWACAGGRQRLFDLKVDALVRKARQARGEGRPFERLERWLTSPRQRVPCWGDAL